MLRIDYTDVDYAHLMQLVARQLNLPVQDNQLLFPPDIATGIYQFVKLPNGLQANIVQCTFHQDLALHRHVIEHEYYTLRFDELVIPGTLVIQTGGTTITEKNTTKAIAYLTSSLQEWSYSATAGISYNGVDVLFSRKWLQQHLFPGKQAVMEDLLQHYFSVSAGNINAEPLDNQYRRWMHQLMEIRHTHPLRLAIIQNRIMLMLEHFFVHAYEYRKNGLPGMVLSPQDLNRVMEVEAILTKDILRTPPSIQALARQMAISESKLKKDFKKVYGYPIYEYYQKARMLAARDRLLTGKYSVKEVALDLGYANISNFTIAFKKEFGMVPSQLTIS